MIYLLGFVAVLLSSALAVALHWCREWRLRRDLLLAELRVFREENQGLRRVIESHVEWLQRNDNGKLDDDTRWLAFDDLFDRLEEHEVCP